jgi:hypothetical protein
MQADFFPPRDPKRDSRLARAHGEQFAAAHIFCFAISREAWFQDQARLATPGCDAKIFAPHYFRRRP